MSTEFFNDQWRIPSNENQNKISNYSMAKGGNSKILSAGSSVNGTSEISVSIWFKSTTGGYVWSFPNTDGGNGFDLNVNNGSARVYFLGSGYFSDSFNYIDGNWHHIVVTYNGATLKFYTDGNPNGSHSVTTTISNGLNLFFVGAFSTSYLYLGATGSYDQATIFDYALSATQVSTLYGGGTAVTNPMVLNPKPIAYYQLGDQSVDNGANYLVPNNSLDGFVFRSVPAQTTAAIPPNTITSNINYTGTPASPSGFTVSFWVKGIGPFGSNQEQLIFDHSATTFTTATAQGVFSFQSGSILLRFGNGTYRYYTIPSGINFDDWNNIVVYFQPGNRSAGKVWINGGTPLALATGGGSSYNDFTSGFRLYLNSFNSNVMYFKNYEIDNAGAALLYNNGSPLSNTSTLAQAPNHWWRLNADDTFDSGTSTWTIKDYIGTSDGTSVNMTSNNLVISDLSNTGGASGYSPYALDFDGINDYLIVDNSNEFLNPDFISISAWYYPTSFVANASIVSSPARGGGWHSYNIDLTSTGTIDVILFTNAGNSETSFSSNALNLNQWNFICMTYDGSNIKVTINNSTESKLRAGGAIQYTINPTGDIEIGKRNGLTFEIAGKLSNIAIWGASLTTAQVTEIYNQGVPSNLNTFSGTAPIGWWQLGSNSSFNPTPPGAGGTWTCLNEGSVTGSNAVSAGSMTNDDITNGVGYSANGLGTSSIEIVGDAPYSTANGLSENMDVLDRSTDVPS